MAAMPGKSPAIVKCPNDFFMTGFQIVKQNGQIAIVPMNIMQMDYISIIFIQNIDQPFCRLTGIEAVITSDPCFQGAKPDLMIGHILDPALIL